MKLETEESGRGRGPRKSDYYDWGKLEDKAKRGRGMIDNWYKVLNEMGAMKLHRMVDRVRTREYAR